MADLKGALTGEYLAEQKAKFFANDITRLAQNIVTKSDPLETCLSRSCIEKTNHVFTHKVDEFKPITNQKSSGRCWIFACLNAMRIPFIKEMNLEDFEFSQTFLFFWDKIERCNYFLNTIVDVAGRDSKETVDGRLISFLLRDPTCDGGQWDMVVNLIEKHGVMPKKCFPETQSSEASRRMNGILKSKLREYCHDLLSLITEGAAKEVVQAKIAKQMSEIYRVVGICLGVPPDTFTWEYYDKSKQYKKIGPISPKDFYENHVKNVFDATTKVCLVTDPRPQNPPGKTYTVDCLGNVVGGKKTVYNNQTVDVLLDLASKTIQAGEPVWFGCEVTKRFASKQGILDLNAHDYKLVFDIEVELGMDKSNRLIYGDSEMNHAMVLTGVSIDDDGKPTKWRIENSWGEDRNEKGYIVMTTEWFREFVFEIVVDRKYVPEEVLDVFKLEPVVLPAWDPMGALAKCNCKAEH